MMESGQSREEATEAVKGSYTLNAFMASIKPPKVKRTRGAKARKPICAPVLAGLQQRK
jgi:hypothetical protein